MIRKQKELGVGVYEAHVGGEELYVYKEIDRSLYQPRDSEGLEQELRNLVRFRNTKAIVRLVAAVISKNLYQTIEVNRTDSSTVLWEILLGHHPDGTIQDALRSTKTHDP
jgi:hypothetical protein